MLLDIILDAVLVVVGSLIALLLLFVALPGLVLYVFRRGRVSRNQGDALRVKAGGNLQVICQKPSEPRGL